jgi:hypothetical protein
MDKLGMDFITVIWVLNVFMVFEIFGMGGDGCSGDSLLLSKIMNKKNRKYGMGFVFVYYLSC